MDELCDPIFRHPSPAGLIFEVGRFLGYGTGPYTREELKTIRWIMETTRRKYEAVDGPR